MKTHQSVTRNIIEGGKGTIADVSDTSNGEGYESVRKWEDHDSVEEEICHEEGGDIDIIQDPPVLAAQPVHKHDTALKCIDNTGLQYCPGMSVLQYESLVKIPNTTLRMDIKLIKEEKFIKVKEGKGCPSVLSKYQQKLLYDVIRRRDQENDDIISKEVAEAMLILKPSLTINQPWSHYTNTLLVKYKYIITGNIKAKKTTTHRTKITVSQKYRW